MPGKTLNVMKEQWREAYQRAGMDWTAIEEKWVKS
jgi:hypothetical protein